MSCKEGGIDEKGVRLADGWKTNSHIHSQNIV